MDLSTPIRILPAKNVSGSIKFPGDKSICHRYAMLAAIADGATKLENFSGGEDCSHTVACIEALGVTVRRNGPTVEITGIGPRLRPPQHSLYCGNSGSTLRMLSGILAAQEFDSELAGDKSLQRRPMARVITPLSKMGAEIEAAEGYRPPLKIRGRRLRGIRYELPVASAQVKTAILFAGLLADGETNVEETVRTRDHGELALRAFGAEVTRKGNSVSILGGQKLHAITALVPGDISSASFFLCAAAIFPESSLVIEDVLLNPTRAALLDVLTAMGLRISVIHLEEHHGELTGSLKIEAGTLKGAVIANPQTAALIDELPVLAAIAPFTEEGIEIRDAGELRFKESDRIALIAKNLRRLGAKCDERDDGLFVPGRQQLRGGEIDSAGDHRIAMAFSIAALRASGETFIRGAECVGVSLPRFFEILENVSVRSTPG